MRVHAREPVVYKPEDMKRLVELLKERQMSVTEIADCLKLDRTKKVWITQMSNIIITIGYDHAITDIKKGVYKILTKDDYDSYEKERIERVKQECEK